MTEILESRIAPASLVDPSTVVYTDSDGDHVTVSFSGAVLTPDNVNAIFHFNTGSVDGDSLLPQQLVKLNVESLGDAATGLDITVGVTTVVGDGHANLKFLNAHHIDLGVVTVMGTLGKIRVGDTDPRTLGLQTLDVAGLGKITGGGASSPLSTIFGGVDEVHIGGDIREAYLRVAGGVGGTIGSATIDGSIIGGDGYRSGAIFATGNIGQLTVTGDIVGGTGIDSGHVGTASFVMHASVGGDIVGGDGARSGVILSTLGMGDVVLGGDLIGGTARNAGQIATGGSIGIVQIGGDIIGGTAKFTGSVLSADGIAGFTGKTVTGGSGFGSGQIGTAGTMGFVTIDLLTGGSGKNSGAILSTGNMGAVAVSGSVLGGTGTRSGHIGAAGNIASVSIGGDLQGFTGDRSGGVHALGDIGGGVFIAGTVTGGSGIHTGSVQAGGFLGQIQIGGDLTGGSSPKSGEIAGGFGVGNIVVDGGMFGARIRAEGGIGNVSAGESIDSTAIRSITGSIGSVTAGLDDIFSATAISHSTISAGQFLGPISATAYGDGHDGITHSTFYAGTGIGTISSFTGGGLAGDSAIEFTTIRSGGFIGNINASSGSGSLGSAMRNVAINARVGIADIVAAGRVDDCAIIAGIDLGSDFISDATLLTGIGGTFNNNAAAKLGFGGNGLAADVVGSGAVGIGSITVTGSKLTDAIILSGVTGRGADNKFGTFDDAVTPGAIVGAISADGGIDPVHVHAGSIGPIQSSSITGSASAQNYFIASDPTGGGIGPVTVTGFGSTPSSKISFSNFLSASNIANVVVAGTGDKGIENSVFAADKDGDGTGSVSGFDVQIDPISVATGMFKVQVSGAFIGDVYSATGSGSVIFLAALDITLLPTPPPGVTLPATGAGIDGCTFVSTGDIGHVAGHAFDSGSGIVNSTFSAGANLASITASGATDYGIANSVFGARGMIGDINADTSGTSGSAIGSSIFQAGTDIGFINASARSATSGWAIQDSGFNAGNDIAQISTTRGITGSVFVAGIHLGKNFAVSGAGGPLSPGMGFGGAGVNADVASASTGTIGDIIVSLGSINSSSFIAGITGRGPNSTFGNADDTTVAGASIGSISAGFGLNSAFFESGTVGPINPGSGAAVNTVVVTTV